ncbi:hypothetical protein ACWT_5974 [Actinoplanes sp. SE50]|nr:hypothetical protein ACPL_6106 [Actinoplanes sp. SE50/110]ATO85389.1 hypothetical protein ACWT_5974 [Actinoplanes sp. SE50]SLM02801.1 hypothetical protein ACSP50_6086 [Actinoplanes sp. SE50/110]
MRRIGLRAPRYVLGDLLLTLLGRAWRRIRRRRRR